MSANKDSSCKKTSIGGQAVLEGIMMRGPEKDALAVRLADGSIDVEILQTKTPKKKSDVRTWPLIRGVAGMIDSLTIGYKALMKSAEKTGLDEEEEAEYEKKRREKAVKKAKKKGLPVPDFDNESEQQKEKEKKRHAFFAALMSFASVIGVVFALFLFLWVPIQLFNLTNNYIFKSVDLSPWRAIFEGVIRIIVFLIYLYVVTLMKDIKRTFQYHGAEHKTIFCYEHGEELTVENVRKYRRFHPRCGTSFLVLILVVSILVSTIVLTIFPKANSVTWLWMLIKILLIPVICSLGYELIRFCGRHDNIFSKIVSAPGLWVQRLTTKEPDDSMIEVAISALKEVIPEDPDADRL